MAINGAEDIDAEAVECAVYAFQSDVKGILARMDDTVSGIVHSIRPLTVASPTFVLDQFTEHLQRHLHTCTEAVRIICMLAILTESNAKAAMALVVHRPLLFFAREQLLHDVQTVILNE